MASEIEKAAIEWYKARLAWAKRPDDEAGQGRANAARRLAEAVEKEIGAPPNEEVCRG